MGHPHLAQLWDEGRTAFGGWIMDHADWAVEGLAAAGFDYVAIDCQHSLISEKDAGRMLAPLVGGPTPLIVRVAANDPTAIGQALDSGADGVIVPLVNTPEEAEAAVAACRFPPHGQRSFGPFGPRLSLDPRELEARVDCFVMVETAEGLENIEEICELPGVTGVYVGPADLAISLGVQPPLQQPPPRVLVDAIERIRSACAASGKVPGVQGLNAADSAARAQQGFRLVSVTASIAQQFTTGARQDLQIARGELIAESTSVRPDLSTVGPL